MAEFAVPVSTVRIHYVCDHCKIGKMRFTEVCLSSMPEQYGHKCDNNACGASGYMDKIYPRIEYREFKPQPTLSPLIQIGASDGA